MDRVTLGIDLGGTNCRAALVRGRGRIGEVFWLSTHMTAGYRPWLAELADLIARVLKVAEVLGLKVAAVGMGVPGVVVDGSVLVSPNLPRLDGQPLASDLSDLLNLPTMVVNDANAICWGEALFGAGREFSSFLTLTLGTGVGGGLVLDRRLWLGADGAAGEVGHLTVVPDGRPCGCGSRGCLEQYASASAMVVAARERLATGQASLLRGLAVKELTSRKVAEAARQGDVLARAVLEDAGRALGQVLAGVVNLLNLDGVVITGGASASLDLLRPAIDEEIRCRALAAPGRRLVIVRGQLGEDAGILGAAALADER